MAYEQNFMVNSRVYDIASEGELANILSHYNQDFIYAAIKQNILNIINMSSNVIRMPNFVAAIEQEFRVLYDRYGTERSTISDKRDETYKMIIDILCQEYHLVFNDTITSDYYSAAYCLYDFLVSNFNTYLVSFFTTYIYNEREMLYNMLDPNIVKRVKDTATTYAKKLFDDMKLTAIASNLYPVLYTMSAFDIDYGTILSMVLTNDIASFIMSITTPNYSFFKDVYCRYLLDPNMLPINITNIRLEMQKRYRSVESSTIAIKQQVNTAE